MGRPTVSSGRHIVLFGQDATEVDLSLFPHVLNITHELRPGRDLELWANVRQELAELLRDCQDGRQHIGDEKPGKKKKKKKKKKRKRNSRFEF